MARSKNFVTSEGYRKEFKGLGDLVWICFLIILYLLFSIPSCMPNNSVKLTITKTTWNDNDLYAEQEKETRTVKVKSQTVLGYDGGFRITFTKVKKDYVEFSTSKYMSDSEEGIDLTSKKKKFTIKKGEKLTLITPTKGVGDMYIIEFK